MAEAQDRPASPEADEQRTAVGTPPVAAASLSPRATQALGVAGGAVKKCESCGRTQPAKRTRCVQCGAPLPDPAPAAAETTATVTEPASAIAPGVAPIAAPPAEAPAPAAEPAPQPEAKAPESAPEPEKAPEKAAEAPEAPAPAPAAEAAPPTAPAASEAQAHPEPSEVTLEALLRAVAATSQPLAPPEPAAAPAPKAEETAPAAAAAEPAAPKAEELAPAPKAEEPPAKAEEPPAPAKAEEPASKVEEPVRAEEPPAPTAAPAPPTPAPAPAPTPAAPAPAAAAPVHEEKREKREHPTGAVRATPPGGVPAAGAKPGAPPAAKPRGPAPGVRTIVSNPASPAAPTTHKEPGAHKEPTAAGLSPKDRDQLKHDVLEAAKRAVDPVTRQIEAGNANMGRIVKAVEALAQDAQKRRKDYDALYAEMRDYKTNFVDAAQKPLFMDLLLLFDALQRVERRFEEATDAVPKADAQKAIVEVKDQLLEVLYRRDIEPIPDRPAKLDVTFQKPVRRIEVTEPAEDRHVVQVVREGFRRGNAVLRPQEVVVKRCVSTPSDEAPIPAEPAAAPEAAPAPATDAGAATATGGEAAG